MFSSILLLVTLAVGQDTQDLINQLQHPDPVKRIEAAKLLGDRGASAKDALRALKKASIDDGDEDVRNAVETIFEENRRSSQGVSEFKRCRSNH